jgi:uncharacterized protein (TIGR03067 family)
MRPLSVISIFVLIALVASIADRAPADAVQNDFVRMQGPWTLYYMEQDGSSFLPGGSVQMIVQGNQFLVAPGTPAATLGQFAQYEMIWPRQINYMPLTGPMAGQVYLGIYDVVGSVQRVCFAQPGQPRPADFNTFPGSGRILNIWLKLQ